MAGPRAFVGASGLGEEGLALAVAPALTPDGVEASPRFFHGFATHPQVLARGLGVLVVALVHARALRAAARTGRLPADLSGPDGWPGLADLAAQPGKSAALVKARDLQSLLT